MACFNPIDHPICFTPPLRTAKSSWTGHIPFAMYLMDLTRPRTLVELGTYLGASYSAFCQAAKELALKTRCYAVDTWQGDEQSGYYGPEILADLRQHHDPLFGSFSQLLQQTFDEALAQFADGEIDLLHIDGYHTYEAVRHDFDGWLPKMSERGIILLHDTNERSPTFGVWKLFQEKKQCYPHFEFLHAHGLGVLAVGQSYPEALRELLGAPEETQAAIRDFFFKQGLHIETEQHAKDLFDQLEASRQAHQFLVQTQSELAQARTELDQVKAFAYEAYNQLKAGQEAQADLEGMRPYTRNLYLENEHLYKNLEAANTEIALMQHSRGVRAIKLARAARHLLTTQGPTAATRQSLLWLSGKRGYWKRLESLHAAPLLASAAQEPATEWTVRDQHLPDAIPFSGASIVIPIFNALEYAKACIESIYQVPTSIPFEVIAIDNGSQPEVLAWLKAESQQRERFFFQSLSLNLGFAKAMNLGMDQARGNYIVMHNSDTIVTSGWLDYLVSTAEHDPQTGIVSPVTNYVGEGWQIDEAARNLKPEEAEAYAARIKTRKGIVPVPDRLVFFSVLMKREVLKAIGGLSESFGLGDYEDDEYCLRARVAGFKLAVAQNAFVYHHGSKTFVTNKIDHASWVDRNLQCYLEKASELAIRRPLQPRLSRAYKRGEVSVIMRTYNRPETLVTALTSLANQTLEAFEVVLVNDGGENVEDIARTFEAYFPITYVRHPEHQGPGAALNTGVCAAQGKWITYLNDDDIVYPGHLETLWATLHFRYPDAHVVYSEHNRALLAGRTMDAPTITRVAAPRWGFSLPDMQVSHYLPIHTWMHSRACYEDVGGFDASLAGLGEWDFQLRVAKRYPFYPTLRMTCEYRFYVDADHVTVKNYHQHLEQLDELYRRHPVDNSAVALQRQQHREHLRHQVAQVERTRQLGEYRIVSPEEAQQKVLSLVVGL